MPFRVKIRIVADNQAESDRAGDFLRALLPGLSLNTGRKGNNPKYADNPQILAYGDLDIPTTDRDRVKPRRRRKATP